MAGATKSSPAPASFAEGMNGVVQAITATMTAPDAAPHLALLQQLLQASVGSLHAGGPKPGGAQAPAGQGGPPGGAPPGGPPGPPMGGGGTNIQQLMGQGGQPPSAGPGGGPSPSGMSADDMRRAMAASAGTAG